MKKSVKSPRASNPSSRAKVSPNPQPMELTDEIRDRIAQKAFELFEMRGGESGHEEEDWLRAEQIIRDDLYRAGRVPS